MPGEYDKQFEQITEILRSNTSRLDSIDGVLQKTVGRVDELRLEVRDLRKEVGDLRGEVGDLRGEVGGLRGEVGELRGEVGKTNSKLDVLSGQFADVVRVVIDHTHRIESIESRLETPDGNAH